MRFFQQLLFGDIFLSMGDLISGQNVRKYLKFLEQSQYWSKEEIEKFQLKKLRQLLSHAGKNVPYYRDSFHEIKLSLKDINHISDLHYLPLLTKEIIKKEGYTRFLSENISGSDNYSSSSSGSTGEPLFFSISKQAYSLNIAASLRGWGWAGYELGDKFVKLSQNPRKKLIKRIQDSATRNMYLSINPLTDENFKFVLQRIEEYKPSIIRCYPDPLLFLARYKRKHGIYLHKPSAIMTTGNTLHPETREEIESAFGCKIFDAYSCEGNTTFFECPTHSCYHASEEYAISEIVAENELDKTSKTGRLISTDLWNYAHPFIRYDTQDFVEMSCDECKCGRKLLAINRIIGRDNDVFRSKSGRIFIVHNFTGFFQTDYSVVKRSVEQFQIENHSFDKTIFRLVVNSSYNDSVREFIKNYWEKELEQPVEIEVVQEIPLTKSGKRKFVLNL